MNHGIYIGVYNTNKRYILEICTTNSFEEQREEARRFSQRTGVNQVYWFQKFPFSMDTNQKEVVSWAVNNGFLVYSYAKD